jgi:glycosyltransferase involved in cell wall biosynthesis
MNIAFLLGSPAISGGSYVIYEHASRLKRQGHRVAIITKHQVRPEEHAWHSSAAELDWLTIKQARKECFDIVLATWWETFFLLRQLEAKQYVYFVQSIESRFFDPPNPLKLHNTENLIWQKLCEKTYACAIPVITEAAWIQEYLHRNYNQQPFLVRNGIRKDIYAADGEVIAPRVPGRFRVLVEGPVEVSFKNVPASLKLARRSGADEVWLLTSSDLKEHPDADRVFSRVPIHETPVVYRSCDLVLKLSYIEGMFGPPLEMFHCGGTALVYDVTGHDEYIAHDRNAYVVPKDDEKQVVRLLRHLRGNPAELARLKRGAAETAAAWPDWAICSGQFEQALLAIAAERPTSRKYLGRYVKELYSIPQPMIRAKMQEAFAQREKAGTSATMSLADRRNFIQLFWDKQGRFSDSKSQHQHYLSGEWTTLSFALRAEEVPLWLRIDPSIRIGITEIAAITVRNTTQNRDILSLQEPEEFRCLLLTGEITWLFLERKNMFFIYGQHAGCVLPTQEAGLYNHGDMLDVSITLRETSIQQLVAEQRISVRDTTALEEKSNVMRLHWGDGEGKFSKKRSMLRQYPSAEWTVISFELTAEEAPLWLRIDPSHRVGIIELAFITVRNKTQGRHVMSLAQQNEFQALFLSADLKWIFSDRKDVVLSNGADPFLILPQIEANQVAIGDIIEISIKLRESGVQEFFDQHPFSFANGTRPPEPAYVPWRKRILRRMF